MSIGWAANILLILGSVLIGSRVRTAFILTLIGESVWLCLSVERNELDGVVLWLAFAALSIRNWIAWKDKHADTGSLSSVCPGDLGVERRQEERK